MLAGGEYGVAIGTSDQTPVNTVGTSNKEEPIYQA